MQPIPGSNFTLASYKCVINHKASKSCKIEYFFSIDFAVHLIFLAFLFVI